MSLKLNSVIRRRILYRFSHIHSGSQSDPTYGGSLVTALKQRAKTAQSPKAAVGHRVIINESFSAFR